ncbi:J domain-containing protein-like [Cloeon dipterum]|uniref:J domain-containing protein-like n=1 Tax=Cloeon dipterum TaxID=197152 RepID=UPI00321FC0C4
MSSAAAAIDQILNYEKNEKEDYYQILGCDESSSVEQITAEYKARALQLHPDKNDGDKESEARFQLLKEARDVLTDPEKKTLYDKWRGSGIAISFKQWMNMKDSVQQSMHWSIPKTKDRMLEEGSSTGGVAAVAREDKRRASEGGPNIRWGVKGSVPWKSESPSEVVSKFRNYEI